MLVTWRRVKEPLNRPWLSMKTARSWGLTGLPLVSHRGVTIGAHLCNGFVQTFQKECGTVLMYERRHFFVDDCESLPTSLEVVEELLVDAHQACTNILSIEFRACEHVGSPPNTCDSYPMTRLRWLFIVCQLGPRTQHIGLTAYSQLTVCDSFVLTWMWS